MEKEFTWLDWQRKAFDEIKTILIEHWNDDKKTFVKLSQENKLLRKSEFIIEGALSTIELSHHVITLWKFDPIIYRVMYHNAISTEDIKERSLFREQYLPDEYLEYYIKQLQFESVLEDSELAKEQKVKGLPVHLFMVGETLGTFLTHYQHFRMIDKIKEAGEKTTIEELREKRVSIDKEAVILDYSPFYKTTLGKGFLLREFFNKGDFLQYKKESLQDINNDIDDFLYFLTQKVKLDQQKKRINIFFGNPDKITKLKYVLKYKDENPVTIPLQLLPKYAGLIRKIAKQDQENNACKESFQFHENKIIKIFLEAVLGESYKEKDTDLQKPSNKTVSAFLNEHIKRRKGKEFDDTSIQVNNKRISKEDLDHESGSLDDWINKNYKDSERLGDIIEDTNTLNPENNILDIERATLEPKLREYLLTDKNLVRFIQLHFNKDGKRRSVKDQKFHERYLKEKWEDKLKEIREKLNITI